MKTSFKSFEDLPAVDLDAVEERARKTARGEQQRRGLRSPEMLFALRNLRRQVDSNAGEVWRHHRKVYHLVVELLAMYSSEQPKFLFDALVLLPSPALEAALIQHRIASEGWETKREQITQSRYNRDGYTWGYMRELAEGGAL